jgi:hypothetical protein
VPKEAISKEAISKEAISKEAISKEAISKEAISKEAILNAPTSLRPLPATTKKNGILQKKTVYVVEPKTWRLQYLVPYSTN